MSDVTTRRFETAIEIAASPDAVWKALSEAGEYTRWFPPQARVEPGAGGSLSWSWSGGWTWEMRIVDWEPGQRLRAVQQRQRAFDIHGQERGDVAPVELALDFRLEGAGGGTRLTLVHSGFGPGAEWDDELDGVTGGWNTELRSLKLYLERHPGQPRHLAWVRVTAPLPVDEAWRRLTAVGGFVTYGRLDALQAGERFRLHLACGDEFTGVAGYVRPQRDFCGTTDDWSTRLLRLSVDHAAGQSALNLNLSAWGEGVDPEGLRAFEERAREALERAAGVRS